MASFSPACQCFFTLLLLFFVAASPLQTHARESRFFSKVSRAQPETTSPKTENSKIENPKNETENISPSSSPSTATTGDKTEQGYGLFGKEETYEYSPTTTNPTKSETRKFKYVEPNGVKEANTPGYRYGAGEKQGMSDTRFLDNGKYYYDINSEEKAVSSNGKLTEDDDDGHESYYGHRYENSGSQFKQESYETGEKQGMSDTRSLDNGRYFYHLGEEEKKQKSNDGYENNVEFYKTNNYGNEEEEEEEEEKYETPAYRTGERQGMSDTRFLHNGRYFYDINNEDPKVVESYEKAKKNDEYSYDKGESYDSNYEKEDQRSDGYDFRRTPNKFPRYEFDSMEEYDKYEQGRSHQKEYAP